MNPIFIIDNSNFIYKFKSVHKYAKVNVSGVSVDISVLVGYIRALKSNIMNDIYIVLDGVPKQSLSLLPSYKGQRNKDTDDSVRVPKLELIKFLTKIGEKIGKNVQVILAPCQEADQVVSSITHIVTKNLPARYRFISQLSTCPLSSDRILRYLDTEDTVLSDFDPADFDSVVIGSTDSDMHQLKRFDNVYVDDSTSGKNISRGTTPDAVHNLPPAAIIVYKAIFGDISDNVPPVNISLSNNQVIELLRNNIKSNSDLDKFLCAVKDSSKTCGTLQIIIESLRKNNQLSAFDRNLSITKLDFYSIPLRIQFMNYDIESTISKYGLRI